MVIQYCDNLDIIWGEDIDGIVQDCSSSMANALELLQFGTEPSIYAKTIDQYQITKRQSNNYVFTSCKEIEILSYIFHI